MTIDKDQLKATAHAASQGHWGQDGFEVHNDDVEDYRVAQCRSMTDATFIAAASPASILELLAENDALRKDAERYRWIRTADWWRSPVCAISNPKEQAKLGSDCPSGERLDAQIDAAMAKEASHG